MRILASLLIFTVSACAQNKTNHYPIEYKVAKAEETVDISLNGFSDDTFEYVFIGNPNTNERSAKSHCVSKARQKAHLFGGDGAKTIVTRQDVEYIDDIVTVKCQVSLKTQP